MQIGTETVTISHIQKNVQFDKMVAVTLLIHVAFVTTLLQKEYVYN